MMKSNYQSTQKKKRKYIPLACEGKITISQAAKKIGITSRVVSFLKKRFRQIGYAAFTNGHKGLKSKYKKFPDSDCEKIVSIYLTEWQNTPFSTFCEALNKFYNIKICYNTLSKILHKHGIKPPRSWSTKEKIQHKPRTERAQAGELIQMDASTHDWFMTGELVTLHGAIDDATHDVTGLYFCEAECRLGYNEVLRQTFTKYGVPRAYYIDRHSSFVKSKKKSQLLAESIEYAKNESTHFVELCHSLQIEVILALSAQAKGRIERLWQTLQGKLPFFFRYLKINTIEKANDFLVDFVKEFNDKYAKPAINPQKAYSAIPSNFDFDYNLSIKFSCKTNASGLFTFHDCDFILDAPRRAPARTSAWKI